MLVLSSCGSAGWGKAAVRIGSYEISRGAVARWAAFEGVLSYRYKPRHRPPPGMVPDPPDYRQCIHYLAGRDARYGGGSTTSELRRRCRSQYLGLRGHVLELLITEYWLRAEAKRRGLRVSRQEIESRIRKEFPQSYEYERFLAITGERDADARYVAERGLLIALLERDVVSAAGLHRRFATYGEYVEAVTEHWKPLTDCRPGYVVYDCKQYHYPGQ